MFKGLLLNRTEDGQTQAAITDIDEAQLPPGDVVVQISHSTLNYKDGLAITGKAPVVRSFPMVPGIDFAGVVQSSTDQRYREGDAVLLNGWGVGEAHWGGLAQKARVKADWLVPLPAGRRSSSRSVTAAESGASSVLVSSRALNMAVSFSKVRAGHEAL